MEVIKAKISQIEKTVSLVTTYKEELDQLIHEKFLEVNNLDEKSQFVSGGKTIVKTFVKDQNVKGYFLKKDDTVSKSFLNIIVDKNYKIVR